MPDMPKAYEPQGIEDALYKLWMESGFFNPDNLPELEARTEAFSIVLPPPNVTGTLHMGHATMLAIQDAMIRFARLRGKRTLWLPGTDHAAIATQSKVEKLIFEKEKKSRHDLGREEFLSRVNQFAQDSHDTIVNQVKKMGSSVDWSREAYTLDAERNRAVNEAFKRMYDDGLIYRGHRVINWDPIGQTTIADDEIVYKETTAKLYTFKYSKDFPISISTTRPETKVGDTAVAVHPTDARYQHLIGQTFDVDFAGTKLSIKIVGDESVDPAFGTGALGVTPAHSTIDFDIAKRHELPLTQVIGEDARMRPIAGELVAGMTTLEARQAVVEWLKQNGLLEAEEDTQQNISTAERTGGVIEPLPKLQWFIDVNKPFQKNGREVTLKSLMQQAVRGGDIQIIPERFEKTYFHWIDNLRDWNISRQLWFGHRVPVWYRRSSGSLQDPGVTKGLEDEIVVGKQPEGEGWVQDEDTLDTWFSSGLWTFSTLGWPDQTEDLKLYHPTSVLETGYDILFFWVARMILMSTYLMDEVPFKHVYLHGLVRDEQGRKMSKSLGNIIDPLDMITKYGADATRLSLVIGSTPGNDVKLSEDKIAGFRNFTNKLWNISRFIQMKTGGLKHVDGVEPKTLADRWILGLFAEVSRKITQNHEAFDLSMAGETLREFSWSEFADWYLEIAKIEGDKDDILNYILERLLIMWHPFMPFVTEEIYKQYGRGLVMVAEWPEFETKMQVEDVTVMSEFKDVVTTIRNLRAEYKIEPKQHIEVKIIGGQHLEDHKAIIEGLTRSTLSWTDVKPEQSVSAVVGSITIHVSLTGLVDVAKETERLKKDFETTKKYVTTVTQKLANTEFVANAPAAVVEAEKAKLAEAEGKLQALEEQLRVLAG
jgi:valyl-tRNA synthetase